MKASATWRKKSISPIAGSETLAQRTLPPKAAVSTLSSMLFPVPGPPVNTESPLFSRMPRRSTAIASLCVSPSHRNRGSGTVSKGLNTRW